MNTPSSRVAERLFVIRINRALRIGIAVAGALIAGCAPQPERDVVLVVSPAPSPWASPTSTMRWNEYACDLIARNQTGQFAASRVLAYVNLSINNAIVSARQQGRKSDGAAAGAAATTLIYLFPKDEQSISGRLAGEIAAMGTDGNQAEFRAGVDIGRTAAADVIGAAKADRSDLAWSGPLPTDPSKWSSRAQPPRPPLGPRLGEMRSFFMNTGADFRAPPPPSFDSPAFRATVLEVRTISDHRTNEQVRIAQYWETVSGSFNAGLWNEAMRNAISSHGLSEPESARVLALVHMVGVDATIACHDSKYTYWVPRPTQVDPDIHLAIAVPNHPSYPANHACISGAMGLVLDAQFPDQGGRYFAMGRQAGESRVYGGIHYRIDLDQGFVIARKVSARALEIGVPPDRVFVAVGR